MSDVAKPDAQNAITHRNVDFLMRWHSFIQSPHSIIKPEGLKKKVNHSIGGVRGATGGHEEDGKPDGKPDGQPRDNPRDNPRDTHGTTTGQPRDNRGTTAGTDRTTTRRHGTLSLAEP